LQDTASSRVGDRLQEGIELRIRASHDVQEVNLKLMNVNVATRFCLKQRMLGSKDFFGCRINKASLCYVG
jgi:hypothetical protein